MERGLIAIITTLIISAVTIFISVSTNLLGISQSRIGFTKQNAEEARYLVSACAEEVLMRLNTNNFTYPFSSPEVLSIDGEDCTIISVTGVTPKEVRTEATVENATRRLKIFVTKPASGLIINSWDEVADF